MWRIQQAGGFLDDGLQQRGEIRQLADFQRNLVQCGQFARAARRTLLELGQSSAQLLDFRGTGRLEVAATSISKS